MYEALGIDLSTGAPLSTQQAFAVVDGTDD